MNYKKLLKKYIEHVVQCKQTTCLGDKFERIASECYSDKYRINDEEWAKLQKLSGDDELRKTTK